MLGTLKEHRRRHTGERPYKCKYCEATFINNSSLKTHTTKHTGILPYKCQACGKLFAKSYGLKMHSLSHSSDKPFVCEVILLMKHFMLNEPARRTNEILDESVWACSHTFIQHFYVTKDICSFTCPTSVNMFHRLAWALFLNS